MKKQNLTNKEEAIYQAVLSFVKEDADLNKLTVNGITARAGIGKGTAYEYFKSREDIIVSAFLYLGRTMIADMAEQVQQKQDFQEKIYYLLQRMEQQDNDRKCLLRYVHLLTGTDALSRAMQQKVKEIKNDCGPMRLIMELVAYGRQEKLLRQDLPDSYLSLAVASRLLSYIAFLGMDDFRHGISREEMKRMLYESMMLEICKEGQEPPYQ